MLLQLPRVIPSKLRTSRLGVTFAADQRSFLSMARPGLMLQTQLQPHIPPNYTPRQRPTKHRCVSIVQQMLYPAQTQNSRKNVRVDHQKLLLGQVQTSTAQQTNIAKKRREQWVQKLLQMFGRAMPPAHHLVAPVYSFFHSPV